MAATSPSAVPPGHSFTGLRLVVLGLAINASLALVKGIAGVAGHCYALVADAIESTADIAVSLIALGGIRVASLPPDADHPYGHGKAEPLTGLAIALAMLVAAGVIAFQSVREILTPHHGPAPFTLGVLVAVVLVKEGLARLVLRRGLAAGSRALVSDAWHHRMDAFTSGAAFVGISVALLGGKGWESADDWAALFASAVIAFGAVRLARPAVAEIMDAAPDPRVTQGVREAAMTVEGVARLEKCHARKMGTAYYVDLHVEVDGGLPVREGHRIAHRVKDAVRGSDLRIADVLVHVEPSPDRGRPVDPPPAP